MSEMKTPLLPGESIIEMQGCSRLVIAADLGGTIFVTNRRIIFETNTVNSKIKEITDLIDVNDVREYAYADTLSIGSLIPIPGLTQNRGVSIRTLHGDYHFTPTNTKRLMESLRQVCPHAVLGEKSSYMEEVKETFFGDRNTDVSKKMEVGIKAGKEKLGNLSGKIRGSDTSSAESPGSSCSAPDPVAEIKRYKELVDIGAITEEEFEAKKKQLLS